VASEICELMEQKAAEHNIEIVKDFSPDIGEVILDPRTLYRSLLNLVSNAVDACIFDESAEKEHRVTVSSKIEDGKFIRFDVSDNGSGMTDEVKNKLFSSFFSTKGTQGTGLGLLVTRKLIEEHGGSMEVESELGKGSTFGIRLPFRTPAESAEV
jgi:signal transduction histidine kinase